MASHTSTIQVILIDTPEKVVDLLTVLHGPTGITANSIAVDLEGVNLGRTGRACILQLFPEWSDTVYLVDLTVLGNKAFEVANTAGESLRGVFEGETFRKVFWDVRNDSDALYFHYGLNLRNCSDLQVLEVCVRRSASEQTRLVHGLARTMKDYGVCSAQWSAVKDRGVKLFDPKLGGSYAVFEARPLDSRILEYCAQDVTLMFELEKALKARLRGTRKAMEKGVVRETEKRITASKATHYNGKGQHMALANISWY